MFEKAFDMPVERFVDRMAYVLIDLVAPSIVAPSKTIAAVACTCPTTAYDDPNCPAHGTHDAR